MDNKLGYNSTDDIILIEEKENLEDNLTKIRNKKDKLLEDMSNYRKEQSSYRNDYENHDAFMNYGSMIVSTNDEIKSITEIENSPYFGHMYLLEKNGDEDVFVGEKSITDFDLKGGKINIVYDWRSPVCSLFYENQSSYKYNEYNYRLKYKRQIKIANKKILDCKEVYNKDSLSEVSDIFLKSILLEKKNKSGFADIIKSIQSKQNEIIRGNINDNVICQGVAGSGKTVIILHRLSYLLFNNPQIQTSSFLFIAPNNIFKKELGNLATKLQIDKIKILTLYEYYIEKFNLFINLSENEKYKIETIIDDKDMDISDIYSKKTLNSKLKIIEDDILNDISHLAKKYKISFETNDTCIEKCKKIYNYLSNELKRFEKLSQKINLNFSKLKSILEKYQMRSFKNIDFDLYKRKVLMDNKNKIEDIKNKKRTIFGLFTRASTNVEIYEIVEKNNVLEKLFQFLEKTQKIKEIKRIDNDIILNSIYLIDNDILTKEKRSHILEYVKNINDSLDELLTINYMDNSKDIKTIYSIMLPRNVVKKCFDKICIGDYKFNTVFSKKEYYRSDIFTILYILDNLGFKKQDKYKYLYIDEAQDYNDLEICLIYNLESSPIMNIYGDFNQNISPNSLPRKDWKFLMENLGNSLKYFELDENYRNTINVVDYCNDNLNLKILPIGVDGEDVVIHHGIDINNIIKKAIEINAVIITNNTKYYDQILEYKKVEVYNLNEVKGLEFPNVRVINDNLTRNQQYVAYTRSLNKLEIYIKK